MKKYSLLALAVSILFLPFFVSGEGPSLIANGDFESASANPSVPQKWSQDSWGTIQANFTYPTAGKNGGNAAKVQVTSRSSGDAKWVHDPVPVATSTYVFSDDYMANVATNVTVEFLMQNGSYQYVWLGDPPATGSAWGTFTSKIVVPTGAKSFSVLHLIDTVGVLSIDNAHLEGPQTTPPAPSPEQQPPPTCTLSANPSTFTAGTASSTVLTFSSQNATGGVIDHSIGAVGSSGSTSTPVFETTTYTGTFSGGGGTTTCAATVRVTPIPSPEPQPPPPPQSGSNLVKNGDLEIGAVNPSMPQDWTNNSWGTIQANFTYPTAGKNGGNAAKVQVTSRSSGDAKWVHDPVPVATSTYVFSDDYMANVATNVTVEFLMQNGSYQYVWLGDPPATGSAWGTFSAPLSVPAGAVSFRVFHVLPAVGSLTIDNVRVEPKPSSLPPPPLPSGSNLVQNGTLESGTNAPTGWTSNWWGSMNAQFTYPATGKNNSRGARVFVSNWRSGDAKWVFPHIAASSNAIYTFTEDYSSNVVTNVTVEFKMSDGTYEYRWLANAPATGSAWGTVEAEVTVPRRAVSFTVMHTMNKNGSLYIDNASITELPNNPFAEGMVTFAFDDGYVSAFSNARPILKNAGMKATYDILTSFVGSAPYMSWANIATLKSEGNEISSHSRTHPDLSTLTSAQAQAEIKGSYDDLVAKGYTPKTFVYPVGGVNPTVEGLVKNTGYSGARGSYFGFNSRTANKYALYDVRVDKSATLAMVKERIDQAYEDKRWLILELHDVLPSGGDELAISTATFQAIVDYSKAKGIKVVTLEEGVSLMTQ